MKNSIFLSILIPVYNPDLKRFAKCLSLLFLQKSDDVEVIVGLQGETDLSELRSKFDFKIIKFDKPSSYKTRIDLINHAKGNYVWFIDCDDEPNPEASKIIKNRCQIENFDILLFGIQERTDRYKRLFVPKIMELHNNEEILNEFYYGNSFYLQLWQKVFKKSVLENAVFPDIDVFCGDDVTFTLAALQKAKNLKSFEDIIYTYRNPTGSADKSAVIKRLKDFQIVYCLIENEKYNYPKISELNIFLTMQYLTHFFNCFSSNLISIDIAAELAKDPSISRAKIYTAKCGKRLKFKFPFKFRMLCLAFNQFASGHFYRSIILCKLFKTFRSIF